jgi:hypothetical protein
MILQYANGSSRKAALMNRTDTGMRVVVEGYDDTILLNRVNNTWVSDDCEAVQVSFEWEGRPAAPLAEEDCVCSPELAAALLRALFGPEEGVLASGLITNATAPVGPLHVN